MLDIIFFQLFILVSALVVLAFSSHYTIKAIEKLIMLTGLSEMSAGFILLATLTSVPEIIVAIFAVMQGEAGLSIGDIVSLSQIFIKQHAKILLQSLIGIFFIQKKSLWKCAIC